MDARIDLSDFEDSAPIISISVSGKEAHIRAFFNRNCSYQLVENHTAGDDYRLAFAKVVFYMHQQTNRAKTITATEQDFVNATDENLIPVLNAILEQDSKLQSEYENEQVNDVYERFYKANESELKKATIGISKSLAKMSALYTSQNAMLSSALSSAMSQYVRPNYLSGLTTAIANMPKLAFQSALSNVPQIKYPRLASAIANIPAATFDVQNLLSPLQRLGETIKHINESLAHSLLGPIMLLGEATKSILTSFDFSLLTYRKEWNEQRETLLGYGWCYSDAFPNDLVNHIYDRREELTTDDVDKLVVAYFRRDRCNTLKNIVKSWNGLPYFSCRKRIFHEALVSHSRRYYNSSVTMLTIHTEGLITDFVRTSLETPRKKVEVAINDIKRELDGSELISFHQYEVFTDVIEKIEATFSENFEKSNPDATSNKSRHKIAHGHVYEPENEVSSLKHFLYLNELHELFSLLNMRLDVA